MRRRKHRSCRAGERQGSPAKSPKPFADRDLKAACPCAVPGGPAPISPNLVAFCAPSLPLLPQNQPPSPPPESPNPQQNPPFPPHLPRCPSSPVPGLARGSALPGAWKGVGRRGCRPRPGASLGSPRSRPSSAGAPAAARRLLRSRGVQAAAEEEGDGEGAGSVAGPSPCRGAGRARRRSARRGCGSPRRRGGRWWSPSSTGAFCAHLPRRSLVDAHLAFGIICASASAGVSYKIQNVDFYLYDPKARFSFRTALSRLSPNIKSKNFDFDFILSICDPFVLKTSNLEFCV